MTRAPAFWWSPHPSLAARLLAPAGLAYGAVTAWRMRKPGLHLPVPVVCVGNLVAGGAGKTPTAIALATTLIGAGWQPAILSRGYGRSAASMARPDPIRVDPARHDASEVGDEPLLLAAVAPTYVSRDRPAAAHRAIAEGATVLLLDDGLQNPSLAKTATVAVVDGATGVGNGCCVPAGPLRAPLVRQWPLVKGVCVLGPGAPGAAVAQAAKARGIPVWHGRLVPDPGVLARLRGSTLVAFAGIGRPEKFFATLHGEGLRLADTRSFPDHHRFTAAELGDLRREAEAAGAILVTTAKDAARLPPGFPATPLPVTLVFDAPETLRRWLAAALGAP